MLKHISVRGPICSCPNSNGQTGIRERKKSVTWLVELRQDIHMDHIAEHIDKHYNNNGQRH